MRRPLRLLVFCHSARLGGSEQLLLQLVTELEAEREVRCTIVVPEDGPLVSRLRAAGSQTWTWTTPWWCRSAPSTAEEGRRILAAGAYGVLSHVADARALDPHAVLSITTVIPWGGLIAGLLEKPHVWYLTDFGGAASRPPHYLVPFEDVRRAIREGADRLIAVSDAVRRRLFPELGEEVSILPPHLDPPPVRSPLTVPASDGAARIVVLGNLRPAKGQWDAVAAVGELSRRGVAAELQLVGSTDGHEEEILEHATRLGVRDRVEVVGLVPDQQPWIAAADMVLVPSHEETFSLVALEAQLLETPLVATRVGGIPEFIHDGVNGLTVPPEEPKAMAAALEALIRDPALARRLAETGRAQALRRFTAENFSGRLRKILDEVTTEPRRRGVPPPLLAPVEALAAEHGRLREELGELRRSRAQAVRTLEAQRTRLRRRIETLQDERDAEAWRRRDAETDRDAEAQRRRDAEADREKLEEAHRRISETRAFRLLQAYWRLVRKLRPRS